MKRSKHSLSFYRLLSCDMGELIPCGLVEVLPGDTFQHSTSALIRCSPMLAPVMHPVDVRVHHWYVPMRILWDNFENFITGGPDGLNADTVPTKSLTVAQTAIGLLPDYLGIPPQVSGTIEVNALPFRAYQMIWNEWYRDQDLTPAASINTGNGPDTLTNLTLRSIAWEKDYFTSARPWEQKGPTVTVPIGTSAPIVFSESGATPGTRTLDRAGSGAAANLRVVEAGTAAAPITAIANLSSASAVTVNLLREALALQRFEEARARYGSRYTEYLRYLGVRSSDARLQKPEYLGGGRQTIQFSEVLQTAEGTNPVGEMRGHGIAAMRSNRYRRFFEEHGYVMSLLSVRPKTMYMDSLKRTWNRRVKEDFWQRELENIGQQEVLKKEIYSNSGDPNGVFGYQDRYDEYRREESNISGEFRSTTLDFWHMARGFAAQPGLNNTFVTCTPTERSFAVPSEDVLYVMANHRITARRLVTKVGSSRTF